MNGVQAEALRAHVARITESDAFANSERLRRFLRFTVEATLGGRADEIKEYTLGREVFDRGDAYDPRLDPIVRVEARRLRSQLGEYYDGPGRDEQLRIVYPKGSYVPIVSKLARSIEHSRPHIRTAWIVTAAVSTLAVVALAVFVLRPPPTVIAPIPARWIEPDDGTLDPIDASLSEAVDAALSNQQTASIVAWPEIARHRNMQATSFRDISYELGATELLIITVRDLPGMRRIAVFLVDAPAGHKRKALFYLDPLSTTFAQAALAGRIARDLKGGSLRN